MRSQEPAAVQGSGETSPSSRTAGSSWTTKGRIGSNGRPRAVARPYRAWPNPSYAGNLLAVHWASESVWPSRQGSGEVYPPAGLEMAWSCIIYVASMSAGIRTTSSLSATPNIWPLPPRHTASADIRWRVRTFGSTRAQVRGSVEHAPPLISEPFANAKHRVDASCTAARALQHCSPSPPPSPISFVMLTDSLPHRAS
jgi:hypothetical protein